MIYRLTSGINLINALSAKDFAALLSRIADSKANNEFAADELRKLSESLDFQENELQLLIQSLAHIFRQSSKFILKPTVLQKQLEEELKFNTPIAEEFVKQWTGKTKADFEDLDNRCRLENVSWQLNVQTASTMSNKEVVPNARLQLDLSRVKDDTKENVTVELKEEELIQLYNSLENIQMKLDIVNNLK